MKNRRGIVLAGGTGSRLYPITSSLSKQLVPVYDKPMIYYPLSVLMLAGIRDVCVITTPESQEHFTSLLGDGAQWGMSLTYIVQASPDGLAQAYILAEEFLDDAPSAMVLGDNIFYGSGFTDLLSAADKRKKVAQFRHMRSLTLGNMELLVLMTMVVLAQLKKSHQSKVELCCNWLYFLDNNAPSEQRQCVLRNAGVRNYISPRILS